MGAIAAAAAGLALAACGGGASAVTSDVGRAAPAAAGVPELTGGGNGFAFGLYRAVAGGEGNLVFSPVSVSVAFAMAQAGARGQTAAQIREVLRFPAGEALHEGMNALTLSLDGLNTEGQTLEVAAGAWARPGHGFRDVYVDTLGRYYGSPLWLADFVGDPEGSRARINEWVAERTRDRIPELLAAGMVGPQTVLVLASAVYLKARWAQPFGETPTREGPFTLLSGSEVTVPLMRNQELEGRYLLADTFAAVEIPYQGGDLAMLLIVPDQGNLAAVEASMTGERLDQLVARLEPGLVDVTVPRWDFETNIDLAKELAKLGLEAPFTAAADFGGITPGPLWIETAVHAANVTVDEHGTEAAAATALSFTESAPPEPDATIRADRPFLFAVRHTPTGQLLFLGRVTDPTA